MVDWKPRSFEVNKPAVQREMDWAIHKVLNQNLPWHIGTLEGSLRINFFPSGFYSNAIKHLESIAKNLCSKCRFDSRNCQMASLLLYMRSPGGTEQASVSSLYCHSKPEDINQLQPFDTRGIMYLLLAKGKLFCRDKCMDNSTFLKFESFKFTSEAHITNCFFF